MHGRFANAAKAGELGDLVGVPRGVGDVAPRLARRPASEAEEFAGSAFLTLGLLLFGNERLQRRPMNEDRAAVIDGLEAVLEPMSDRIGVNAEELGNLAGIID